MIKYIKIIALFVVAALAISACTEELERADYISFQGATVGMAIPIPGSDETEIKVYTTTKSGSDRTFEITVDPSSTANPDNYTVPSSVVIPANTNVGSFTVQATASFIDGFLLLKVEPTGSMIAGPAIRVNISGLCLDPNVILEFEFDGYASETSWIITTGDDVTVKSIAAGTYEDGDENATEGLCLPSGTYTLTVNDSFGDGLSFPADGSFTLKLSDGTVLGGTSGDFGDSYSFEFIVP